MRPTWLSGDLSSDRDRAFSPGTFGTGRRRVDQYPRTWMIFLERTRLATGQHSRADCPDGGPPNVRTVSCSLCLRTNLSPPPSWVWWGQQETALTGWVPKIWTSLL